MKKDKILAEIDEFFREPSISPTNNVVNVQTYGNLYLLRRDILKAIKNDTQWLAVMGVMAGFDLLAKLSSGADTGHSGPRFKNFLKEFSNLPQSDCEVIYQLRNSLLHSFGLYSKTPVKKQARKDYQFLLHTCGTQLLKQTDSEDVHLTDQNQNTLLVTIEVWSIDSKKLMIFK